MDNSKSKNIASYVIQGLVGIMFLMGAVGNLLESEMAITQAAGVGIPPTAVFSLGVILLVSTILYVIPKSNVLGAAFLTAWLGGAVAVHIMNGDPLFNKIMPVVFGVVIWVGIWLRNKKLREVFPIY
jgi:hypothetical protein